MVANTSKESSTVRSHALTLGTVRLQKFAMEKAVNYTMFKDTSLVECEESVVTVLDGNVPQWVVSADGYDLLYRIPAAFRGKALVRALRAASHQYLYTPPQEYVSQLCRGWGERAKIKKSVANDKKGHYHRVPGSLVGTTRLSTLWHTIGHKVSL